MEKIIELERLKSELEIQSYVSRTLNELGNAAKLQLIIVTAKQFALEELIEELESIVGEGFYYEILVECSNEEPTWTKIHLKEPIAEAAVKRLSQFSGSKNVQLKFYQRITKSEYDS